MFSTQLSVRKIRGVRESPMARMTADRKLKNIIVLAPRKLMTAKVVASGSSSSGVCIRRSAGPASSGAATVSTTLVAADRTAPAATDRRTAAWSPAPNACAVGIAKPFVMPHAKPSRRNSSAPVAPTAARESTPSTRPTTTASAAW